MSSDAQDDRASGRSRKAFIRIARSIKGDASFDIDSSVGFRDLAGFIMRRAAMALRGCILTFRTGHPVFPVFVGQRVRITGKRHLRLSRGVTIGDYCCLDCLGSTGVILGQGVTLRRGVQVEVTSVLREPGVGLIIGDQAGVSEGCFIGAKGLVTIGAGTIIGPSSRLIAENHVFASLDTPIRLQGTTRVGITIGQDCWLGADVTVLDGVTIGDGAVIGAGAVVTKDAQASAVTLGAPARFVKARS